MNPQKIVKVAVEQTTFNFDKLFDYTVPIELENAAKPGARVLVPFGRGNKKRQGFICEVSNKTDLQKIKPISNIINEDVLLNDEMLKLAHFIKDKTFCTMFDALKVLLPTGMNLKIVSSYSVKNDITEEEILLLNETEKQITMFLLKSMASVTKKRIIEIMGLDENNKLLDELCSKNILIRSDEIVRKAADATEKMVRLFFNDEEFEEILSENKLTPKQKNVVEFLKEAGVVSLNELCYFAAVTPAVIKALQKKNIIEIFNREILRNPNKGYLKKSNDDKMLLTEEQNKAYKNLLLDYKSGKPKVSLLYGITGSGKTRVFMKLARDVLNDGKSVIILVPEISLTPQTLSLFFSKFGDTIAVLHSNLSLGERMDEWKKIKAGKAKIVIGTRSAVFAPCENIGLIIIDEEQEHTYKSESSPRYHTRDIAKFRANYHNSVLLLSSATPSLESYYNALNGKYSLNKLNERYGNAVLPKVEVVDLKEELLTGNHTAISERLIADLKDNLNNKKQSIILINRRGYNTFIACASCGHVITCKNCSISMTYHLANKHMMCHYCGAVEPLLEKCEECGSDKIRYSGFGTQKAEEELSSHLPDAKILRLDTDTTMAKSSHEKKLKAFATGEYDILLGTQMVAKGLDFPNVTLVGVISADQSMYSDDYKSFEKTFSLLTQVVGRAGRGECLGKAVIQTINPENPIINFAKNQDYEAFYEAEIMSRKVMLYPPFCNLCLIGLVGTNLEELKEAAFFFLEQLKTLAYNEYNKLPLRVLEPSAALVSKISNKYRFRIIIKCRDTKQFRQMIGRLLIDFGKNKKFSNVRIYADINPENIL